MFSLSKNSKLLIIFVLVALICVVIYYKYMDIPKQIKKKTNFSRNITNLQASMSRLAAVNRAGQSKFFIKFTYTNPSSFGKKFDGTTDATAGFPIFYLLDYYVDKNATPLVPITNPNNNKQHPDVTTLLGQTYLKKDPADSRAYPPVIQRGSTSDQNGTYYTKLSDTYATASINVSGSINENSGGSENNKIYLLDIDTFTSKDNIIKSGDKFWFGIAIQSSEPAGWGDPDRLPKVYGNFTYVELTAQDPSPPGIISNLIGGDGNRVQYNY